LRYLGNRGNRSNLHNSFGGGNRDKKVAVKLNNIKKESKERKLKEILT